MNDSRAREAPALGASSAHRAGAAPPLSRRPVICALLHFSLIAAIAFSYFHLFGTGPYHGDLLLYHRWSRSVLWGWIPYADFAFEYPPLALAAMLVPNVLALDSTLSFPEYTAFFLLGSTGASAMLGLRLARFVEGRGGSFAGTFLVYTILLCPLAPLMAARFDLVPAACAVLGVLSAIEVRAARSGAWLAVGTAVKVFPIILIPLVAAWYVARRSWSSLSRLALSSILTIVLCLAPAALLAGEGIFTFLDYHRLRGLQIESLLAGWIGLASALAGDGLALATVREFGAFHLDAPIADGMARATPLATLLVLGLLLAAFARRFAGDGDDRSSLLLLAAAASLTGFVATNKVFSPQYVIWLVPWLALVPRPALSSAPRFLLVVLTIAVHPLTYDSLVRQEVSALLWLNMRNAVLIWILVELARRARRPSGMGTAT